MNSKIVFFLSVLYVSILLLFSACENKNQNHCQVLKEQGIVDDYKYPIVPGTPEWEKFESHTEMLEVCQIPEQILSSMCTHGLVVTCMNYPLIGDILAFNHIQTGYNSVTYGFNGLQELHNRPDALIEVMDYYRNYDFENIVSIYKQGDTYRAMDLVTKFFITGVILSQKALLDQSNVLSRYELVSLALIRHNDMKENPVIDWWICYSSNVNIMAKTMLFTHYNPFEEAVEKNPFLGNILEEKGKPLHLITDEEISEIIDYAKSFVNN